MANLKNPASPSSAPMTAERVLIIKREFNAPLELVWKAWTDPEHFKNWWGPKGFTTPVSEMDFRVGGKYHYCMRSPEGKDYWGTGIFSEIVPKKRLVYTDSFSDEKGNVVPATDYGMEGFPLEMKVIVSFEEKNGKTLMTLKHEGLPGGEMKDMTSAGWNESFDKLAELLK